MRINSTSVTRLFTSSPHTTTAVPPASPPTSRDTMRGKRSKAYRKLMTVYAQSFGFREPYQVLVDPSIIEDASKFKMDLTAGLERTLQGKVKPMITQCCIRQLYATDNQPLITLAKTFERRRCNHSITAPALSPLECLHSIVIPSEEAPIPNKHRYVVATDDQKIREKFREYPGVPGIHIMRSVMVLDQISGATTDYREREEKGKLRSGLKDKAPSRKRKRDDEETENRDSDDSGAESDDETTAKNTGDKDSAAKSAADRMAPKQKKPYGKKQPNPLSVMKKKKRPPTASTAKAAKSTSGDGAGAGGKAKRKRKRAHASGSDATGDAPNASGDVNASTD
ncbi:hypothetical protein H072_9078 [Dactylellina haptotyla CBS 200.50]|uniref:U three protein 23 n=1 Tax=Dactylellina haptotyla (strain CBS 200.50) TaxID=1284197 RepID=S8BPZ7_DACHA|nr:hypothetical protein H072_9078 [Dactylellina haptotyla CBS 200.50]